MKTTSQLKNQNIGRVPVLLVALLFTLPNCGLSWDYGNGRHGSYILTTNATIGQLYQTVCLTNDPAQYNPTNSNAIPNFQNLIITNGATLTANAWNGSTGGWVVLKVQATLSIASGSAISVSGQGYRGGVSGQQGESYAGSQSTSTSANYGGGGGGYSQGGGGGQVYYWPGAGGGYGSGGANGSTFIIGYGSVVGSYGGNSYGTVALATNYFGSGGGGGVGSSGGNGGGAIEIEAGRLLVGGQIQANGNGGGTATYYTDGGGGSGGSILLRVASASLATNNVTAMGGTAQGAAGNGGDGRIAVYYAENYAGGTTPVAYTLLDTNSDNVTIITNQPSSQISFLGSNVVFSVGVSGFSPLFFQWSFNNAPVPSATNQIFTLANLNFTNQGNYSVSISNVVGVVVSSNAYLTVLDPRDPFGDGIPNWWKTQYGLSLTDPTLGTNFPPGDLLTYQEKYLYGLNPTNIDTDGDGLSDYAEIFIYHSNPANAFTGGDGIPDGWKETNGLNPSIAYANVEAGFDGVTYLQIYQYDLTHSNQLNPNTPFAAGSSFSNYEIVNGGAHTNRFYYDHEDRLLGMETSHGVSIGYQYDGNGNLLQQSVLSRASETNGLPVLWLWLNGLTNQPGIAYANSSGNGWNNYQEYLAGANPNDPTNQPDLLNNPGVNIGSLTFPFIPSNCVVAVGQLDNSGADEIVVGADGDATATTNSLFILKEGFHGWSVQKLDIGAFGVTSLGIGQPANRPAPAIYAGLRQTGGTGKILELMNVAGVWQTNVLATSTNTAAFVLGVRSNLDLLASYAPSNGIDGGLYSIAYSTNWNSVLVDTNASHRGLGIVTPSQTQLKQLNNSPIRLLDEGGIAAGTKQITDLIPGLVSYWKLDEPSGNAMDSFGTNTLINNNGVIYDSGLIQNCADFGSSNIHEYLATGANLGISATTSCSYSLWVKMNSEINSGIQGFGSLLFQNGVYLIIQYQYNGGSRGLNFYYGRGGAGNFSNFFPTTLGTSQWHHLVFTYNMSTGEIRGYLDGIDAIDYTNNSTITSTYNFVNLFTLGCGWDSGSVDTFASCKIDEAGMWSRALSPAEVNLLYGNGFGLSYSPLSVLSEPAATNRFLWRGLSLAAGTPRTAYTNEASVFYAFVDDNDGNGQIDAGDDFVLAEYTVGSTNTSLLTLTRTPIASVYAAQSYGLASVNFLNSSNQVLFTAEPDGNIFAWTATNGTAPLQRQLFSGNYAGNAWHALTKVRTLEPGEGLAGLMVDPTNQNVCNVIFWMPQAVLPTPQPSLIETAPFAAVIPSAYPLGSNAVVTVRLWDNEGTPQLRSFNFNFLVRPTGKTPRSPLWMVRGLQSGDARHALPSGNNHTLGWNALADVGANVVTNILLRASAQDFMLTGSWSQPTPFQLNTTVALPSPIRRIRR
jgi:YD repeat-containing protein